MALGRARKVLNARFHAVIPAEPYRICAVDGGGSGCRAALAGRTGPIGFFGNSGPANFTTDPEQAIANVHSAIADALARAGLAAEAAGKMCGHVGLAGVLTRADARSVATEMPFAQCIVTDDRAPMVAGALGGSDGVLLSVGTGSFGAVCKAGAVQYVGGWGLTLGDDASGAWLGRELLAWTLRAMDGLVAHSGLTRATAARFDNTPADIVTFAGTAQPRDYAAFAPEIVDAAIARDTVAHDLMRRGGAYLASVVASADPAPDAVLCLAGGLGPQYAPYLPKQDQHRLRDPLGTALEGGVALARDALHAPSRGVSPK